MRPFEHARDCNHRANASARAMSSSFSHGHNGRRVAIATQERDAVFDRDVLFVVGSFGLAM